MIATYGDLVGWAGVDIHTGLLRVMRRGFVDHKQAQNTVGAYYDLLAALRSHTWWLIDPARARGEELARAMHRKADDTDLDMVAARLFAGFGPLAQRPVWLPYPDPDFDHPWRDAADKIGAATDLLETHLGPHREPRSEQACLVLDPGQRRGALGFVAMLTSVTMSADSVIGAACRHRDIPWQTVTKWLPDRDATKVLVHRMGELAAQHGDGRSLRDITANLYPVREDDPVVELGDRMLRLRHAAWGLAATTPDYSVVTLHDLAGLGMATHLHTAIAHGLDLGDVAPSPHRLVATAQAFQELMIDLRDYLAPGPPDPGIRMDILAARELLMQIAPLHRPTRALTISDPTTRATLSALHGACEVMGQVARMNQATFATLARSEQIHVPTRLLDGDILSDDPTTAQAKLNGVRRVIAPPARVRQTLQHYEAIGAVTGHVALYQPAVAHAADYEHPALFRQAEFEGRP